MGEEMPQNEVWWEMLDVSPPTAQAEANLIRFADGPLILIDAGQYNDRLQAALKHYGIHHIDKVFLSHTHKDHYNGLQALLKSHVGIGSIYMNIPDEARCATEIPWGCDYADVLSIVEAAKKRNIPVKPMKRGDILVKHRGAELKVLYAFDGVNTPVGPTDINDMSVIMSLTNGTQKALFTGDLNYKIGNYLAELKDPELKANLFKVPHHGADSIAPRSLIEWSSPEHSFVSASKELWLSERCKNARSWFDHGNGRVHNTGIEGAIRIKISPTQTKISGSRWL